MKSRYILTHYNEPVTDIVISASFAVITKDKDCDPIIFLTKDSVVKMCLALSVLLDCYDFGWERIYV